MQTSTVKPARRRWGIALLTALTLTLGLASAPAATAADTAAITGFATKTVAPHSGITVTPILQVGANSQILNALAVTTNASGAFTVTGLAANTAYRLRFDATGHTRQYFAGRVTQANSDPVTTGAAGSTVTTDTRVKLSATTESSLFGTVRNAEGLPVSGIRVLTHLSFFGGWIPGAEATTDPRGNFLVAGLAPGEPIKIRFSDAAGNFSTKWYPNGSDADSGTEVTSPAAGTTGTLPTVSLLPTDGAKVQGKALTPLGFGISGITVHAYGQNQSGTWTSAHTATTNASGTYTFQNLTAATAYKLRFIPAGSTWNEKYYKSWTTLAAADEIPTGAYGTTTSADAVNMIRTNPATIAGTVNNLEGSGIVAEALAQDVDGDWVSQRTAITTGTGAFTLHGLEPNTDHRIRFTNPFSDEFPDQYYLGALTPAAATIVTTGAAGSTTTLPPGAVVRRTATSTAATVDTNTIEFGEPVTITATVTPSTTGTVELRNGNTTIATATLAASTASWTVSDLTIGTHALTVRYLGNSTHRASTSSTTTVTVTAAEQPVDPTDPNTPGTPAVVAGAVTIAGQPVAKRTLTARTSGWTTGATLTYQWRADGTAIPGATAATFKVTKKRAGKRISVSVTGTYVGHTAATATSAATLPAIAIGKAKIKGKKRVGKKLTAKTPKWASGTAFTYRWFVAGKKVKGKKAAKAKFKLVKKYQGKKVKVRVTAKKANYPNLKVTSKATKKIKKR